MKVFYLSQSRLEWIEEGILDYEKRLKTKLKVCWYCYKDEKQLLKGLSKEKYCICLDEKGKIFDSEAFSRYLFKNFEKAGSRMCVVIGAADGLPKALREKYPLLSLSPMTFPHHFVRLFFIEQVYRAFEIEKGSAYHKS